MPYDDRDDEVGQAISKLQAPNSPKCGVCGSDKIFPAMLFGGNMNFQISVMAEPDALIFKGWETSELEARVCGDCGHVRFFAKAAASLYSVYVQSKANTRERKDGERG